MKEIPGIPGYAVDEEGNVYSLNYWGKKGNVQKLKIQKGSNGYPIITVSVNGKQKSYTVHSLMGKAYLDYTPHLRDFVIDHIDDDKTNNKLSNLRVITQRQNAIKSKPIRELPTGVCYYRGRTKPYMATIQLYDKQKFLGYFETPEEAGEAYQEALSNIGRPSGNF